VRSLVLAVALGLTATTAAAQDEVSCHSVVRGETGLPGPNLAGIVGRRAGQDRRFPDYSPALKQAAARGLAWTPQTLDRFLANPEAVIPKTAMNYMVLKKPADRQTVIAYLRRRR
jgi:cytochrome c